MGEAGQRALEVLRELKAFDDGSGYVFPSATRHDTPFLNYGKTARNVKAKARLAEDWNIYDLKSTVLTGLESLGVPGAVISAVANHAPTSVTSRHYAFHDFAEEKREALDAWGRHVGKLDPATKADVVRMRRSAR